jgi:hypothetical protein
VQAARACSSGVRNDNTPMVRFSATVGEEPEIEVRWQSFSNHTEMAGG